MRPTPRRLPILTAGLLSAGMVLFISRRIVPAAAAPALTVIAEVIFAAGLLVALLGMAWSICTLTSPILRRTRGITTPVVTILIALLAWIGAGLTLHLFKQSSADLPGRDAARSDHGAERSGK